MSNSFIPVNSDGEALTFLDTFKVTMTGSNTRELISDTILIGTGSAHTAGDIVSTDAGEILEFDCVGLIPAGGSGMILDSIVTSDNNAVFTGGTGYTLHLFSSSPTVQADNAVFDIGTNYASWVGKITIGTLVDYGSACLVNDTGHNLSFTLAEGSTKLYGKVVCNGGETTISAKTLKYSLGISCL